MAINSEILFKWVKIIRDFISAIVVPLILGIILYKLRLRDKRARELEKMIQEKRRKKYYNFIQFIWQLADNNVNLSEKQIRSKFKEFKRELPFIASDNVIKALKRLEENYSNITDIKSKEFIEYVGSLLKEMRKDMGYPKTKLSKSELLETHTNEDLIKFSKSFKKIVSITFTLLIFIIILSFITNYSTYNNMTITISLIFISILLLIVFIIIIFYR